MWMLHFPATEGQALAEVTEKWTLDDLSWWHLFRAERAKAERDAAERMKQR